MTDRDCWTEEQSSLLLVFYDAPLLLISLLLTRHLTMAQLFSLVLRKIVEETLAETQYQEKLVRMAVIEAAKYEPLFFHRTSNHELCYLRP